jgi:hypothetical protein
MFNSLDAPQKIPRSMVLSVAVHVWIFLLCLLSSDI